MQWIVTWVVVTFAHVPCPIPADQAEAVFGVTRPKHYVSRPTCVERIDTPRHMEFYTKREAELFVQQGRKLCDQFSGCSIVGWEITESN